MNTIDPSFLQQGAQSHSVIRKLEEADNKRSFKAELKDEVEKNSVSNKKEPIDKKLMDTCVDFESIFVKKLFDEMRKTVHKTGMINGGHAEEIFEDFLYDEYAKITSKNSNIGIAAMLYKQLS
jgi:flagellar protein FlgJ